MGSHVVEYLRVAITFIWSNIRTIGIADVLDIAIVAFLIYKAMRFLSRTGSASVIRGVFLVVIAMWVSSLLEMNVIAFLLGRTLELGFLALIVLFQPELRRMLERLGSGRLTQLLGRTAVTKEMESAIHQTIEACTEMSKSKTGALIIFERNIKLDDAIKTGTVLDATIQSELLKNIFFNKAPLHDGAVIIRDARIIAAGCMLPLSANPNLSRELGMRHRAGIGISEVTDAVVVVVSEETGSISIAIEGMLKRHLAPDTFEKLLRNELLPNEEENRSKLKINRAARVKKHDKKDN